MAKHTKKTSSEKTPARASKLRIIEACAAKGCEAAPENEAIFCKAHAGTKIDSNPAHGIPGGDDDASRTNGRKAAEAKWDELAEANAPARAETQALALRLAALIGRKRMSKEVGIVSARLWRWLQGEAAASPEHRAAMIELIAKHAAKAEEKAAAKAAKPQEKPKAQRISSALSPERQKTVARLQGWLSALGAAGTSDEQLMKLSGADADQLAAWRAGTSAGSAPARKALRAAAEKLEAKGSRKAPEASAAKRSKLPKSQKAIVNALQAQLAGLLANS